MTSARRSLDPYLWLEDIGGDEPLNWVREHNATTTSEFSGARFDEMRAEALTILNTDAQIPYVRRRGEYLYNFWRDATNSRGLWRRTTLDRYRRHDPEWDVVIDVDALAAAEDENWVWAGAAVLRPDFRRALVSLSRGGSDAVVVREFDLETRQFVAGGFELPEAKTQIGWVDADTVYVGTDFGPGSLTDSGYPRLVKRWKRGQSLDDAELVFSGEASDVTVGASFDDTPGFERTLISRATDFFNSEVHELTADGELLRIDVPTDASASIHREWLLIELKSSWQVGDIEYSAGTLLAARYGDYVAGVRALTPVFVPDEHASLHHYAWTRDRLTVAILRDVASEILVFTPGSWRSEPLPGVPDNATTQIVAIDDLGDEIFLDTSGFTQPSTLLRGEVGAAGASVSPIKSAPSFFDDAAFEVAQHFARSDDGTSIPYFVVRAKGSEAAGPTLLGGYGGFEVARTPGYDGVLGRLWLSRGGTYVLANIRGGGEYGPVWHTQAMREGRHLVYEDFAAVARDLVARGITTAAQLGAQGGSNGGLLMGVMLTAYPELFGALVCQVPLLDMRRYHLLLAGASWVAEYGDPDNPEDWEFISKYSPYQNISMDRRYPPVLVTTSTRDDRVHPGHARKMTAALQEAGQPVWYYENIEGGHGGAANNEQSAFKAALAIEFLWRQLAP
ncbi:prolyl oligopeptidase family serine peptidase [Mycobacteroides abscessus]|uniref:prolyl oligopeptidase family serine peptidase n=1 Tax=Mycobacteroides abscessus TaxID=36809 RepID=UPI00078BDA94|nr:prolyl oligopeptidase family serine peptidase [Mycobacteroides abscessus]AMU22792.1 prolyl oligopeptidase [Mycobacteroides abscessus]MDO3332169.1 prolyl oligopeptidase family serine peptidase [Mycobacteroides abscessus subsp. bolletii]QSM88514.1 S9 family peptidase [Mycobacteroides abscessus subsp. bolletii]SIA80074.1 exported prolyl oligopeptidase [Mycobacteroides abscessus subsp. bolletii]SII86013.1 Probable peptidase [Mycobacteroides abscessus subsp. bolletii]